MYEIKDHEKKVRMVRRVKKIAKKKKKACAPDILEHQAVTPVGTVRTLCFGFEDRAKTPIFFDLHGGGFVMGHADADIHICRFLHANCGCKVVSIEYSKAPEHPYPQAVNEVYETIRYFIAHGEEFGIDPERMCIGGHSAGGNLAAVTCLRSVRKKEFSFRGQILDYPPLDLSIDPYDKPCPKCAIKPWIASAFDACYLPDSRHEVNPDISPVYSRKEDLAQLPPTLLIAAGKDSLHDEAVRYYDLLCKAGADARLLEYPNARHGFTMEDSPDTQSALQSMAEFLNKHL